MTFTTLLAIIIFLSLVVLTIKIKSELPETLKLEIEKNRDVYEFIKRRRFVKPENIVVDFQRINPKDSEYKSHLDICIKELKERSSGKYNTLSKIGNFFELSENSKKFFLYENPTVKQLIKYIFKHEIEIESELQKISE